MTNITYNQTGFSYNQVGYTYNGDPILDVTVPVSVFTVRVSKFDPTVVANENLDISIKPQSYAYSLSSKSYIENRLIEGLADIKVPNSLARKTNAIIAGGSYTYNQVGFTYNQVGIPYGGADRTQDVFMSNLDVKSFVPQFKV